MKKTLSIFLLLWTIIGVYAQTATIVLNVPEVIWQSNPGYQLLLDSTATQTDAYLNIGLIDCDSSYDNWTHTIPENATASNDFVVSLNQEAINIPAGTYDYLVVNPNCENAGVIGISTDQCDPARGNNFTFEEGKIYTFTLSKQFNPIYYAETDCVTLTIADDPTNNIEIIEKESCHIYPNPASRQITILGENIQKIEIINLLGQTILTSSSNNINISILPNGSYFVRLYFENRNTLTKKLIKR